MSYFVLEADPREDQYGRLVSAVLGSLQTAVGRREQAGVTRKAIADRMGCDRSQLSRVVNGRVGNLTLRTISDILWATEHEPREFMADAYEDLSPNYTPNQCYEPVIRWHDVQLQAPPAVTSASTGTASSRVRFDRIVERADA